MLPALTRRKIKPFLPPAGAVLLLLPGCAGITTGSGVYNDPVPTGSIVAQGQLNPENGQTMAGNVAIYSTTNADGTCNFTLRLQSISAPAVSNLEVVPTVNGASVSPTFYVLRGSSGNQNYLFSEVNCSVSWTQVQIVNPSAVPTATGLYGLANLTQV